MNTKHSYLASVLRPRVIYIALELVNDIVVDKENSPLPIWRAMRFRKAHIRKPFYEDLLTSSSPVVTLTDI